jgi:hypothetical protein
MCFSSARCFLWEHAQCMHILMFEMLEAHMLVQEGLVHTIHG